MRTILAFIRANPLAMAIAALALLALIGGAYWKGRHDGVALEQGRTAKAALAAAKQDAKLNDVADRERLSDAAEQQKRETTYANAINSAPPGEPGHATRALACARLRAANPGVDLPAACGHTGVR